MPEADMWEEERNGVVVDTIGTAQDDFRNEQCAYWWFGNNDLNEAFEAVRNAEYTSSLIWQLDVNITELRGTTV